MRQRKQQRLIHFDYTTPGAYFVTICVSDMQCKLGDVVEGQMVLNEAGELVKTCWLDLPHHYSNCDLDEFVVMPNHFHGIVRIVGNGLKPFPTQHGLPEIVRGLKTFSSRRINASKSGNPFQWQKSFYDRVVRNENELHLIREYIVNNPMSWELDKNNQDINGNHLFVGNSRDCSLQERG